MNEQAAEQRQETRVPTPPPIPQSPPSQPTVKDPLGLGTEYDDLRNRFEMEKPDSKPKQRVSPVEEFKNRAEQLHKEISGTRQNLINEYSQVKAFKAEILELVDNLRSYYNDLNRKERILGLTIEGLGSGRREDSIEQQEEKRRLL